jgi:hypothetical protein
VKKLLLSIGLMASLVSAKDMTGRLGLGGTSALGGSNGVTAAFQVSKMLVADATFGMTMNDGDLNWNLSGHGLLNFADFENANLLLGVGINVNSVANMDQGLGMSIDLPIRPVIWLNDRISIQAETGLSINFMQPGNDVGTVEHESVTRITLGAQLLASAGILFWF